jgi:hypothetical protein
MPCHHPSNCSSAAPVKSDGSIGARLICDRGAASLAFLSARGEPGRLSGGQPASLNRWCECASSLRRARHETGGRSIAIGRFLFPCGSLLEWRRVWILSRIPPYTDPIAHAWRHCNPHAPLPPALAKRAPSRDLARSVYVSNDQTEAGSSGTAADARQRFVSFAIEPSISHQKSE